MRENGVECIADGDIRYRAAALHCSGAPDGGSVQQGILRMTTVSARKEQRTFPTVCLKQGKWGVSI